MNSLTIFLALIVSVPVSQHIFILHYLINLVNWYKTASFKWLVYKGVGTPLPLWGGLLNICHVFDNPASFVHSFCLNVFIHYEMSLQHRSQNTNLACSWVTVCDTPTQDFSLGSWWHEKADVIHPSVSMATDTAGSLGSEVPELPGSGPVSSVKLKCLGQTAVSALSGGSIGAFAKVATEICWGNYFQLFSGWARHLKSIGDSLRSKIHFNKLPSCTAKLKWIILFETMTHFQRLLIMEEPFPLRIFDS